ncbi:hypothetical protein BDR22DRAFT_821695 [Usnea florida]
MHAQSFVALSICFLLKATTIRAQACYFPDGSISTRDAPCRASSPDQPSPCCAATDVCLDNALCLAQSGSESISRGTCTDETWRSSECPQYCQDVYTSVGVGIFTAANGRSYCCGPPNSSDTCKQTTRGSNTPFPLVAGRVIYNRTSGSISPNVSDTTTVTVTSTVVISASPPSSPSQDLTSRPNSSCPSDKSTAVGLGVGVPLGTACLCALGLLWRQRSREQGARREARALEEKYHGVRNEQQGHSMSVDGTVQELQHEYRNPDEIDGRLVYEIPDHRAG